MTAHDATLFAARLIFAPMDTLTMTESGMLVVGLATLIAAIAIAIEYVNNNKPKRRRR